MNIGFLGAGCWGFCLASLLAGKGHRVASWTTNTELAEELNRKGEHPRLRGQRAPVGLTFTTDLAKALEGADIVVEAVTSAGLRPVFQKVKAIAPPKCPIVITSKGIEQHTGLILPDVAVEVFGGGIRARVGMLSGPGYAEEVIRGLPASVVGSAYSPEVMKLICDLFTTQTFRVYPNPDIHGVAFGGALKNIIAIACGIAGGLSLGNGAAAALITRGLNEIRKLAVAAGCKPDTLNGLSGMGDLVLTCSSPISRNFRLGSQIAQGATPEEAMKKIEMVVEGVYTCVSALELSQKLHIPMPITETVYKILYDHLKPKDAVALLMSRPIKEEHV